MTNKNTKQVIKPIYHLLIVGLLVTLFIVLNVTEIINKNTPAPAGLDQAVQFVLSVRSIYLLPCVFLLLVGLGYKLRGRIKWDTKLRSASFWALSFFTGKLYTWGAFFLAWGLVPYFVTYVEPFPNAIAWGLVSIMLGWVIWLQARSFAHWVWRQA